MNRSGHSQERPIFKPLLATTTSKSVSKNYLSSVHSKSSFVNGGKNGLF